MLDEVKEAVGEELPTDADNAPEDAEVASDGIKEESDNSDSAEYPTDEISEDIPDYEEIMREDLKELRRSFPELSSLSDICELPNPIRYAELRDLGLSAREAYLAASGHIRRDNRGHLSSAVQKRAGSPRGGMSRNELSALRELFPGLGDAELQGLYRKVNV